MEFVPIPLRSATPPSFRLLMLLILMDGTAQYGLCQASPRALAPTCNFDVTLAPQSKMWIRDVREAAVVRAPSAKGEEGEIVAGKPIAWIERKEA